MKRTISIVGKVFAKAVALIVLSVITIFAGVFKVFRLIYRFTATPIAIVGIFIVGYSCVVEGVSTNNIVAIACFVLMVVIQYLLTPIATVIENCRTSLKNFVYAPLTIKSPVRYTL